MAWDTNRNMVWDTNRNMAWNTSVFGQEGKKVSYAAFQPSPSEAAAVGKRESTVQWTDMATEQRSDRVATEQRSDRVATEQRSYRMATQQIMATEQRFDRMATEQRPDRISTDQRPDRISTDQWPTMQKAHKSSIQLDAEDCAFFGVGSLIDRRYGAVADSGRDLWSMPKSLVYTHGLRDVFHPLLAVRPEALECINDAKKSILDTLDHLLRENITDFYRTKFRIGVQRAVSTTTRRNPFACRPS
jgi:hypothetical protein